MGCYISHKPKQTYPQIDLFDHTSNSTKKFCKNYVHTTKYTFYSFPFKFMAEQLMRVSNIFFITNSILTCIPQVSAVTPIAYLVPLMFILGAALFRELREDITRYIDDLKADRVKYIRVDKTGEYEVKASELLPGDVILMKQGQRCPADLMPIHTTSMDPILIQTAEIDGETAPKEIFVSRRLLQYSKEELIQSKTTITCDAPNAKFDSFRGVVTVNGDKIGCDQSMLMFQGSILRSDDLLCSVIYTGDFTKLALNRTKRRMRLSGTDRQMNSFISVVFLVVLGISVFCSIMATIMFYHNQNHWYLGLEKESTDLTVKEFFSYFTLSSYLIPIACAVCMEIAKTIQSLFMRWDTEFKYQTEEEGEKGIDVRCTAMNDELGFVEYVLTDKTGTLTENEMNFVECIIDNRVYKEFELGYYCDLVKEEEMSQEDKALLDMTVTETSEARRSRNVTPMASPAVIIDDYKYERETNTSESSDNELSTEQLISKKDSSIVKKTIENVVQPQVQSFERMNVPKKIEYKYNKEEIDKSKIIDFIHCMALCHNATVKNGKFKSPSPDEEALLRAAQKNGVTFTQRLQSSLKINHPDEEEVQILATFPFSSERARSSVLVKMGERIVLFTKGADHVINPLCVNGEFCDVSPLASRGLRTLVLCKREVSEEFYINWSKQWDEAQGKLEGRENAIKKVTALMENELVVLGCTGVEDKLQEGVPETLQMLNRAGIKIWVITGDKEETGIAVGKSCGLLEDCVLIHVNGKTSMECHEMLTKANDQLKVEIGIKHGLIITANAIDICVEECRNLFKQVATAVEVVMCCRSMPLQKSKIAKHVREITKKKCLAIGDGANDIPMINAASVSVGIYGKEGSQAARSADYSIYRFKHLAKLILFHGRMSLYRNTSIIKLIFFKNAAYFLHLLWFACICMFTSQRLYDDYMMALYNFIFTSIPPVFIAFFDTDLPWSVIRDHPEVNRELIRNKRGSLKSYLGWFAYGAYQSIVYFMLMMTMNKNDVFSLNGKTSGMVASSAIITTYTTLGVIATFATCVKRWNGPIIFGFIVAIISYFFTYIFLASFAGATRENMSYFSFWRALEMPHFYLSTLLAVVLAVTPSILKNYLNRFMNPMNYELMQVYEKDKERKVNKEMGSRLNSGRYKTLE